MSRRLVLSAIALIAGLTSFSAILPAQTAPANPAGEANQEKWNNVPLRKSAYAGKKSAPAPLRDLSGIWDAATSAGVGLEDQGAPAMPEDGKPEHQIPFTALGLEKFKLTKPSNGPRQAALGQINDPLYICDPMGFPRIDLFELRTIELVQAANQVIMLNEYYGQWRIIWTDGRELPKDPDPRWNGYSVGKWVDDYTFVVETVGMKEDTWIDNVGRPHSDALRVEERFHRVDHDNMELTMTIDDPKMYTKPWLALDKYPLRLQSPDFDMPEYLCAPSEMGDYNSQIGNEAAPPASRSK
jgi:hypothetical protein